MSSYEQTYVSGSYQLGRMYLHTLGLLSVNGANNLIAIRCAYKRFCYLRQALRSVKKYALSMTLLVKCENL